MLNDILLLDEQLTEEELAVQKTTRDYCEKALMPGIQDANRNKFLIKKFIELGSLGLLGPHLHGMDVLE